MTSERRDPIFIPVDAVAARLGISAAAFRRQMADLIDLRDFPQPMPYQGPHGATIWRAAHVDSWLREQGLPVVNTPPRSIDDPKVAILYRKAASA